MKIMNGRIKMTKIEKQIIGISPKIKSIRNALKNIANSSDNVLVSGDIGTGKHHVAKVIQSLSGKNSDKAVEFNCFATPERLHEEKLFGYVDEQGNEFSGLIDDAAEATLMLVQFEKLSEVAQSGLLNILLYGKFFRKNGIDDVDANLRIISITDRDMAELNDNPDFDNNLLSKLNEVEIHLPPLSEREEDIPLLFEHFLKQESTKTKRKIPKISPEIIEHLFMRKWKGNVAQLRSVANTMLVSSGGKDLKLDLLISYSNEESTDLLLKLYYQFKAKGQTIKELRYDIERTVLNRALVETNYNAKRAGINIGLSEPGMRMAMKRLGILTKKQKKNLLM